MTKQSIKTILLNGEPVGEYESTGDVKKDKIIVEKFLKEKGLYREFSKTDGIHGQANVFAHTANLLYNEGLKTSPYKGDKLSPFIVNAVFSIELYLKTILEELGQNVPKEHKIITLYNLLPDDTKKVFLESAEQILPRYNITEGWDIIDCLKSINKAFEKWRYIYDYNGSEIEIQAIRYVMHTVHETCCRIRKI